MRPNLTKDNNWIQTFTGKAFWPLNPDPNDVDIVDIAHALGMLCRYGGHVRKFYSVAEHCWLLSYAVSPKYALWALLHDSSEAYLLDIPSPIKRQLPEYKQHETRLMECIAARFGLEMPEPPEIKAADTRILFNERAALLNTSIREWQLTGEPLPNIEIQAWSPEVATKMFLARFKELTNGKYAITKAPAKKMPMYRYQVTGTIRYFTHCPGGVHQSRWGTTEQCDGHPQELKVNEEVQATTLVRANKKVESELVKKYGQVSWPNGQFTIMLEEESEAV